MISGTRSVYFLYCTGSLILERATQYAVIRRPPWSPAIAVPDRARATLAQIPGPRLRSAYHQEGAVQSVDQRPFALVASRQVLGAEHEERVRPLLGQGAQVRGIGPGGASDRTLDARGREYARGALLEGAARLLGRRMGQ